jgi:hypothetical protein
MADRRNSMSAYRTGKLNSADVQRRLKFLMQEAKQDDPVYDQTVRMAFRVVSNFICIGFDCDSRTFRAQCKYRSADAHTLIQKAPSPTDKSLGKLVTNEHQEPLACIWKWMLENRASLTVEMLGERMRKWSVVVITTDENRNKLIKTCDPTERYSRLSVLRNDNGNWEPHDPSNGPGPSVAV